MTYYAVGNFKLDQSTRISKNGVYVCNVSASDPSNSLSNPDPRSIIYMPYDDNYAHVNMNYPEHRYKLQPIVKFNDPMCNPYSFWPTPLKPYTQSGPRLRRQVGEWALNDDAFILAHGAEVGRVDLREGQGMYGPLEKDLHFLSESQSQLGTRCATFYYKQFPGIHYLNLTRWIDDEETEDKESLFRERISTLRSQLDEETHLIIIGSERDLPLLAHMGFHDNVCVAFINLELAANCMNQGLIIKLRRNPSKCLVVICDDTSDADMANVRKLFGDFLNTA